MGKSTFFTGQPVFNQLLSFIPRTMISRIGKLYSTDRYCKKFKTYDHLITMLYCTLHQCNSLREVVTGMQAASVRLSHLGLNNTPRRSTLADANKRRSSDFFQDLYHSLYQRYYGHLPDSLKGKKFIDKLFIVDSTIISLFSTVMQSTGSYGLNGKKKGGIKAHVLMRAKDNVPSFIRLSEGRQSDSPFLNTLILPKGSIVVMDKGYRSYKKFIEWTHMDITWVTRLNPRFVYELTAKKDISEADLAMGVINDYNIDLGNPKTISINPIQKARLIIYIDPISKKQFQFITNNFKLSAKTIADIYKSRWQIELLFKRIKQNFQLHYFLGDNENAIRIQLWCALIADLLLKIIKDKIDKKENGPWLTWQVWSDCI